MTNKWNVSRKRIYKFMKKITDNILYLVVSTQYSIQMHNHDLWLELFPRLFNGKWNEPISLPLNSQWWARAAWTPGFTAAYLLRGNTTSSGCSNRPSRTTTSPLNTNRTARDATSTRWPYRYWTLGALSATKIFLKFDCHTT